jgi:hypothetical protein
MNLLRRSFTVLSALLFAWAGSTKVSANAYRENGVEVRIGELALVPPRDWNRLSAKPGKFAETWTLDGEQLNEVTLYFGVAAGEPLVRERNRKREPLPKYLSNTLLADLPEMLERTYRASRQIVDFKLIEAKPDRFLDRDGLRFTYEYLDDDNLTRRGEALATIASGKLYMMTFDAPRLHYFDRTLGDFRTLAAAASLAKR